MAEWHGGFDPYGAIFDFLPDMNIHLSLEKFARHIHIILSLK